MKKFIFLMTAICSAAFLSPLPAHAGSKAIDDYYAEKAAMQEREDREHAETQDFYDNLYKDQKKSSRNESADTGFSDKPACGIFTGCHANDRVRNDTSSASHQLENSFDKPSAHRSLGDIVSDQLKPSGGQ